MVTNPKIVFLIVTSLAVYALAGLGATVFLIVNKADAALIAVVAGQAGTALGGLLSTLNNTRTQAGATGASGSDVTSTSTVVTTTSPSASTPDPSKAQPVVVQNQEPIKVDDINNDKKENKT